MNIILINLSSMEYYEELIKFLNQSKTENLKTKEYLKHINDLQIKVSFGQGNQAKIPWISFLKQPNTTSNGIYPVYLLYKEENILILSYGISETNEPKFNWDLDGVETIEDYFERNFQKKPERYGKSLIYKVYSLDEDLTRETVNKDLGTIIQFYIEKINQGIVKSEIITPTQTAFNVSNFRKACEDAGLLYDSELITRFVASLLTKPFVILTGLSGSGKTKLAQAFVQWICQDKSQYRIIPVGADWTNREPLLGYPNALQPNEYVKPDNEALDVILQANQNPDLPHFLILDEMNLSHVERYFADFLSVMESKEFIPLYAEDSEDKGVPAQVKLPDNLFIIGTVNIDETTNMFSPKVLDRANTIEFRVTKDEMADFLSHIKEINMDALLMQGATMSKDFIVNAADKSFASDAEINNALIQFFEELKKTGAEFGYRSATEILRLIQQLSKLDTALDTDRKIDIAIMQKLLPKLHGSRRKLIPILEALGTFCISEDLKIVKDVFEKAEFDFNGANVKYPLSLEKITRMYKGAIDNGFASYAEA